MDGEAPSAFVQNLVAQAAQATAEAAGRSGTSPAAGLFGMAASGPYMGGVYGTGTRFASSSAAGSGYEGLAGRAVDPTARSTSPRFAPGFGASLPEEELLGGVGTGSPGMGGGTQRLDTSPVSPIFNRQRQTGGNGRPLTPILQRGAQTSSSSTSLARLDSSPVVWRRELETMESRLNAQISRMRDGTSNALQKTDKLREVALSRLEQKVANCEIAQSKLDRRLSEISGTLRGLSDEAQNHIRRADAVDARLWDFRHQLEAEFKQKFSENVLQFQEMASKCHINLAAGEDQYKRIHKDLKRLEGQLQECYSPDGVPLVQTLHSLQARLDALEDARAEAAAASLGAVGSDSQARNMLVHSAALPVEPPDTSRLWSLEQQLKDVEQKVERLNAEAHGETGWGVQLHEQNVRISALRSKLDGQDALCAALDSKFHRELEQRSEQLRKNIQDIANKVMETTERHEALDRSTQATTAALEELQMGRYLNTPPRMQVHNTAPGSPVRPIEASTDSGLGDELMQKLSAQVFALQEDLRNLESIVGSNERKERGAIAQLELEIQQLSDQFRPFSLDFASTMADRAKVEGGTAGDLELKQKIAERLQRQDEKMRGYEEVLSRVVAKVESFGAQPEVHDRGSGNERLWEEVALLKKQMPGVELIGRKTTELAELAQALGEVQRESSRRLEAQLLVPVAPDSMVPNGVGPPQGTLADEVRVLHTRVAANEDAIAAVARRVEELARPLLGAELAVPSGMAGMPLLALDEVTAAPGSELVAQELGGLFMRVEEGEQECAKLQEQLKARIGTMDQLLDKVAREVLGPDGAAVASRIAIAAGAVESISRQLPADGLRLCVLGGALFHDPACRQLAEAIAQRASRELGDQLVVITTAQQGVQESFVKSLSANVAVYNLVAAGESNSFGMGTDIPVGESLEERLVLLGQLGEVYITIEGGPVTAKEAKAVYARGAVVLPLIGWGGASAGMFDFPSGALRRPDFATQAQWDSLHDKSSPERTAEAVAEMLQTLVERRQRLHTIMP